MDELTDRSSVRVTLADDLPTAPTVRVVGELDLSNVELARRELEACLTGKAERVTFDVSDLTFMDSTGIALLIETANRVGSVRVAHPNPIVRRILEVTGLATSFGIGDRI